MDQLLPLAGGTHDRAGERRTDAQWTQAARRDPASRIVVLTREGALVTGESGTAGPDDWATPQDGRLRVARMAVPDGIPEDAVLLGVGEDDGAVFAVDALPPTVTRPDAVHAFDARAAAMLLSPPDAGLLAQANTLLHWHRTARFCGSCGRPTTVRDAGHVRVCEEGHEQHPRTDPVVIMLVVDRDQDRILLGRQPSWPARRYSSLAGFVEPGEALEAAVAREVHEEARVRVGRIRYVASQPWPFPASLMLAFEADWVSGEAAVGDDELDDVRWCTRDEVQAAVAAEGDERFGADAPLLLPPPLAIARHLVDRWLAV